MLRALLLTVVLTFLGAEVFALGDGADGWTRIRGANCNIPNHRFITSLNISFINNKVVITTYNGPLNPVKPVNVYSVGGGEYRSIVGLPKYDQETLVIRLDNEMQNLLQKPYLVLVARVLYGNMEMSTQNFLLDPRQLMGEKSFECKPYLDPIAEDLDIINSELVEKTENPAICSIEYRDTNANRWIHGCTAALIRGGNALSAAHCHEKFFDKTTRVKCGSSPEILTIAEWERNPAYGFEGRGENPAMDISVLKLDPTPTAPSYAVASSGREAQRMVMSSECWHYGRGSRQDNSIGDSFKSRYQFPDAFFGGRKLVEYGFYQWEMIVSNVENFIRSGDSGGPIICTGEDGAPTIVGVHSLISSLMGKSAMTSLSWDFIQSFINQPE